MNKVLGASLVGLIALGANVASAQTAEPYMEMRPYVSAMYSHVFDNDDRDFPLGADAGGVDEGKGFQLGAGKAINRYWGWEMSAFGHSYSKDNGGENSQRDYGGKLDGLFFYSRDPRFSPYFGIGVGGIRTELKGTGENSTDAFADVGVGFMKFFTIAGQDLGFRGDLRYRRVFFPEDAFDQSSFDDIGEAVLNVGLVVPLGPKPVVAKPVPTACADSDGDGVCDTADLCPETPKGTPVDAKGCPVEKPTKASDPNQKFEDVHFAFDKSDLTDYAKALLDNAANVINGLAKKYPSLKVDVQGHTDWVGTDAYNQGLSERRANSVKTYLVRKGVDASRISTYAYGEAKPIATNESEEGRALNRRSEVRTREK
ncbi:MAG TPA: OmpA family protein [Nevskiaceae bacterium]|nr:OmpA family protein [Nevskiaceae bacterium]